MECAMDMIQQFLNTVNEHPMLAAMAESQLINDHESIALK